MKHQIDYQPALRPALFQVEGCKEYRDERSLFENIDELLTKSGLEQEFINLSANQRGIDPSKMNPRQIDFFCNGCVMALRGNVARIIKKLSHREFCKLLPDSQLLRWFLLIERVDGVKAYAKSSSDRFAHWLNESSLQHINQRLTQLLQKQASQPISDFEFEEPLDFETAYFDSTCLKADIHFPVDWVLLRDIVRTLMKATVLIRKEGLKHRMPQEPLKFLSDINSLCMQMTAKYRTIDGKKHRKKVLRSMKHLTQRIQKHASNHLDILQKRGHETELSQGRITVIEKRLQSVLEQVKPAIKQAHERIIGGRKLKNKDKILSLYDLEVEVIKRGKSTAESEFGNKLWLGENKQGLIIDYQLEQSQSSDTKHVIPAIKRLVEEQALPLKNIFGDRGLDSKENGQFLQGKSINNGICPKNVHELKERLANEPELRMGLKRRAGTEARISILLKNFMGSRNDDKPRAKGIEHRQMVVGWAVLAHNLWLLARLPRASSNREKLPPPEVQAA